jgi:transcriptional regulator with XRE-family HTH domain
LFRNQNHNIRGDGHGQVLFSEQMATEQNMIGPALRSLREAEGLTQAELAARLQLSGWDISRETLAKVESQVRCVTDRELVRFAEALEVDPSELLKPTRF